MSGKLGRLFLVLGLLLLVGLFAWEAFADEAHIIEVRRNIPLADHDPVYKDFYINAGNEAGLKQNLVVRALRKINVKDASGATAYGELLVPVGQLKILFVQNRLAVAREYKSLSRADYPMLEQTGILSGDIIDLKGSFVDNHKPSDTQNAQKEPATNEDHPVAKINSETPDNPVAAQEQAAMDSMAEAMARVAQKPE